MDPDRVRAYLQVACAGLGFDIGEVWWTSNENGASTVAAIEEPVAPNSLVPANGAPKRFRFVQLYTSKSYENRRSELVNPPENSGENGDNGGAVEPGGLKRGNSSENLEKHVLSPRLVDAIAQTTQVVWANSKKQEGLIGRSDIRLQTAVGMPVAVDGNGNMCVVVMFSPNNINSTDDAMEYLQSISLSATSSSIPCLMPVLDPSASGMRRLTHPDMHQHASSPHPDANALGEGVVARFVSLDSEFAVPGTQNGQELAAAPQDNFGIPMLPPLAEVGNVASDSDPDIFDLDTYGIWSTIMETFQDENVSVDPAVFDVQGELPSDSVAPETNAVSDPAMHVVLPRGAPMSVNRKIRLEEFLSAFLDMSVFDLADVWVPAGNEYPDCLRHVTSVTSSTRNSILNDFKSESANTLVKYWNGAVGRAYSSGNPVWSANSSIFVDSGRAAAFQKTKIMTVLAVPVFSSKETLPACVVSCYSLVSSGSVPFVLKFVQQALRLLWDGLDNVEPHESVGRSVWQEVAPADLGEMAADVEMQQHFMKKRPHSLMSSVDRPVAAPAPDPETSKLAAHLQTIRLPSGETITVPLQLSESPAPAVNVEHVQSHVYEAIRSVASAVPFDHVSTNAEGTKRAHVMGSVGDHRPLPMPHSFPTMIIGAKQSPVAGQTVAQHFTPVVVHPPAYNYVVPQQQAYGGLPGFIGNQMESVSLSGYGGQGGIAEATKTPGQVGSNQFCMPTTAEVHAGSAASRPGDSFCRIQGCGDPVVARRPYCAKHSGNRQCEHPTCPKCAQGSTRFCIAHGGGRRCTFVGCDKGARDKFFCAAHGGGKRCKFDGCSKSAVGGSSLCTAHGGGRRCAIEGCDKSAQSSTKFCVKHGGGKKCAHEGCTKVARGRTQFCAAHGGGVRCKLEGCNRVAIGKMQLCRAHGGGARAGNAAVSPVSNFVPC